MLLKGIDGTQVDIKINGYQYPDLNDDPFGYDLNWLSISVSVQTHGGNWSGTDSCMNTAEAQELLEWLKGLKRRDNRILYGFIEPSIYFQSWGMNMDQISLDVFVNGPFHPAYRNSKPWSNNDHMINLKLKSEDINTAIDQWNKEIATFPCRGYENNSFNKWYGYVYE